MPIVGRDKWFWLMQAIASLVSLSWKSSPFSIDICIVYFNPVVKYTVYMISFFTSVKFVSRTPPLKNVAGYWDEKVSLSFDLTTGFQVLNFSFAETCWFFFFWKSYSWNYMYENKVLLLIMKIVKIIM